MSFAHAQHTYAPNGTFNDVAGNQYYNIYQSVDSVSSGLLKLQPAAMDASQRTGCLDKTRVNLLKFIEDWADDLSCEQSVLWLHGLAGVGKSTLSTTIANRFRTARRLGAFLFFDRDVTQRNDPNTVVRTIAFQLGIFDHRIGAAILAAIDNIPNVCFLAPQSQFQLLVIEPLLSLRRPEVSYKEISGELMQQEKPVVVVLDALDECGNPRARSNLLAVLSEQTATLAPQLRFIVTSRTEHDICSSLESHSYILPHELDTISDTNAADILLYFQHRARLTRKRNKYLRLPGDWPGDDVLQTLVRRACGLFVWAATAWEFIDAAHYPPKHLEVLLKGQVGAKAEAALDALYRTALESAGDWDDEDFIHDFRMILGIIITARNPLSLDTIDQLLRLPQDQPSIHTVSRLGCVIASIPVARILHPSFADFLFSRARCGRDDWHFDAATCHRHLAIRCLERLSDTLKRNMCDLTLSVDLENETLPEDMTYACLFWIDHVCLVGVDILPVMIHLQAFVDLHLLHWFEAMIILRRSRDTIMLLNKLSVWVTTNSSDRNNVVELVRDAYRFSQTFAGPIEEHPLLVYFAALPFTPINSSIYRKFHDPHSFPTISGGFQQSWSSTQLILAGHKHIVRAVAFSPDGTRIVSGSDDNTIRVWDALLGVETLPALRGHKGGVHSVAFSPDGTRIVSGSDDNTIRVWDALLGVETFPALRGHEDSVESVAFSPDGTRIVSGSMDKTIRLWDGLSGIETLPILRGHEDIVSSVTFSPDGTRIVSGSWDNTIRLWDVLSGVETLPALRGHESIVKSVTFSPDGTSIVSGSYDKTIRVWDALSGVEILSALRGHENVVASVAFSPDSTHIVSGSYDRTIRVWDALSGVETLPALRGHESSVESVAFSPDSTCILSGSRDSIVRVWDALSGVETCLALGGHKDIINSIAFSLDGSRIVSGSRDKTIRVWDALSSVETLPALRGHENSVESVSFSPDGTRIVSGSQDKTIRVWDALLGIETLPALRGHEDSVHSVAFSPDGMRIVSGSWDKTIRVWDLLSGIETLPALRGHEDTIMSVAFSPNGTRIVSGSWDKTIRVWDALSGVEILPALRGHEVVADPITFSPDGTRIITSSQNHAICVWDALLGNKAPLVKWHENLIGSVTSLLVQIIQPFVYGMQQLNLITFSAHTIMLTHTKWLVDLHTNRTVSKLPATIVPISPASHKKSFAIGTLVGRIVIINFPPAVFAGSETRYIEGKSRLRDD